jgi:hypothetical protein
MPESLSSQPRRSKNLLHGHAVHVVGINASNMQQSGAARCVKSPQEPLLAPLPGGWIVLMGGWFEYAIGILASFLPYFCERFTCSI